MINIEQDLRYSSKEGRQGLDRLMNIAEVVRWQLEKQYGDLRGLNDIAAQSLFLHLKSMGIECRIVKGTLKTDKDIKIFHLIGPVEHYWVVVGDQVIDILADLFNPLLNKPMPKIYIGNGDRHIPE